MIKYLISSSLTAVAALSVGFGAPPEPFQVEPVIPAVSAFELDPLVVIGSEEAVTELSGSGAFLDAADIREQGYVNGNRILNEVPGVYVREEDGFGNFPNISIRGGDGTRNEKITVMEDGILSAPAPYSSPGAYYSPKAARMSGIEVLKGSSQVRFGPHTTGGVINYLSTPVPEDHRVFLRATYGSWGTFQGQLYVGDSVEAPGVGRFGYLLEAFYQGSQGYRTIDGAPGVPRSEETGFSLVEPMLKIFWEPDSALYQRFEAKYGYSEFDSDETYVGLTERDFRRDPYRRYAGSFRDHIATEHHRSYLKYTIKPTDRITIGAAGYYNAFARNWYKIRNVNGESLHEVLARPTSFPAAFDAIRLRGEGELGLRANARDYHLYGSQLTADIETATGSIEHELHLGIRYHVDEIRRFQRDDSVLVGPAGFEEIVRGEPGSGGNRYQQSEALALWIEDNIELGAFSLRPGLRYETIALHNTDFESNSQNRVTAVRNGNIDYLAPGIGTNYEVSEATHIFGGVYRGVSVPSPRAHLEGGVEIEESIGYELGLRRRTEKLGLELVAFLSDFDNLTGTDAGLGGDATVNAGEAEVYGVEASVSCDPLCGSAISMPLHLSATWTQATLSRTLATGGADNIYAGGRAGADIPYVPEWKLSAGIGLAAERWGINLLATYSSEAFGTARNRAAPVDSSRQGIIDEVFLLDLSAHYLLRENVRLLAGIQNLLDESHLVSRLPEGPRAGAPRSIYAGIEVKF